MDPKGSTQPMSNYSELKKIELLLAIKQSTKEFWLKNQKEKLYRENTMRKQGNARFKGY